MNFQYSKMILIVDSSQYSAQMTSRLLRSWGFSSEVTHSTIAALKMLNNGEVFPDMIFVDMANPNDIMFRFPVEIHSNPLWRSMPIMARCASSDSQSIVRAVESGYCDFIVRPTEPDVLREKIEKALNRSLSICRRQRPQSPEPSRFSRTQRASFQSCSEFRQTNWRCPGGI